MTMSALSAESTFGVFPVTVPIPAATVRLGVTDRNGTHRELAVDFTATSFTVNSATLAADLAAIATHVDGRIQAATALLQPPLPAAAPALLQPVRLRRVRGASGGALAPSSSTSASTRTTGTGRPSSRWLPRRRPRRSAWIPARPP